MKPSEMIAAALPLLSDKERQELLEHLSAVQNPCTRHGHKFRKVATIAATYFALAKTKMCCEKCGHIIVVQ